MTTTEPATTANPFEDQLETLSWHLRANPQLFEVGAVHNHHSQHDLDVQLGYGATIADLATWGLSLTAVTVSVRAIKEQWFVDVFGTMADVHVRVWTAVDIQDGDTSQTIAAMLSGPLATVLSVGDAPVGV